jgi:hypothetical protein
MNAHIEHKTLQSGTAGKWLPWAIVMLIVVIDAAVIWLVADNWAKVRPFIPWALLAVVVAGLVVRGIKSARTPMQPLP